MQRLECRDIKLTTACEQPEQVNSLLLEFLRELSKNVLDIYRSLKALHTYERTSAKQHQAVSEILGSRTLLKYEEAIHKEVTLSTNTEPSQNYFNNCVVHVYQSGPPVAPTTLYSSNTSPYIAHDAVEQLLSDINLDDLLD